MRGDAATITSLYRFALQRPPLPEEIKLLAELVAKHRAEYVADADAAKSIVTIGVQPAPSNLDLAELSAWTSAARVVLNLHEFVTRE